MQSKQEVDFGIYRGSDYATVNPNAQPPIVGEEVEFVEMKLRQLICNM